MKNNHSPIMLTCMLRFMYDLHMCTGLQSFNGTMGIMDAVTFLGMAAGTLTTISFIPQVIRIWKTRSTKDISVGMFMLFCAGIFLWILYGFLINSLPVIITNIVTFIFALIILGLKLRNG
jgi:MtN3 and saliva related transmembrane protein